VQKTSTVGSFILTKSRNLKEMTGSLKVASNVPMVNTIQDQTSETHGQDMPESYFPHFHYRVTLAKYARDG